MLLVLPVPDSNFPLTLFNIIFIVFLFSKKYLLKKKKKKKQTNKQAKIQSVVEPSPAQFQSTYDKPNLSQLYNERPL